MVQKAVTEVRLDSRPARSELRQLNKDAEKSSKAMGAKIRSTIGQGFGAIGLGAGIGAGLAAVRSATSGGVGDVATEAFSGIGQSINDFFLGDADDSARGKMRAMQELQQSHAHVVQKDTPISAGLVKMFNARADFLTKEEEGKSEIKKQLGPEFDDLLERLGKMIEERLTKAAEYLLAGLPNWVRGK
jgi:hypothetical protein